MSSSKKFDSCYVFFKKMERDSLSYNTIFTNYLKKDLHVLPIPLLDINFSNKRYFEQIDFSTYEESLNFILNQNNDIISDFNENDCLWPLYEIRDLSGILGAERKNFVLYSFDENSFYFFVYKLKGLFEIDNNKIYYIFSYIDYSKYSTEMLDKDIKEIKKNKLINFIKIDFDILLDKFNLEEIEEFESTKNNKKKYRLYKRLSRRKSKSKRKTNFEII